MKRLSLLIMLAVCLALAAPAGAAVEDMLSIINRYGDAGHGTDWELAMVPGSDFTQMPLAGTTHDFGWVESMPSQFTLKYDPTTGLLTYTIGGTTLTTTFFAPQSAESFVLEIFGGARSTQGEISSVMVDYLRVDGQRVHGQVYARSQWNQTHSLVLDNLPKDGFTITGEMTMKTTHQVVQSSHVRHPGHSNPHGHAYGHGWQPAIISLGGSLATELTLKANVPQLPLHGGLGAVPEPGTMLLLGSGLAGLAAWRARRTRRRKKG